MDQANQKLTMSESALQASMEEDATKRPCARRRASKATSSVHSGLPSPDYKHAHEPRSRVLWSIRLTFVVSLIVVAVTLGSLAHWFLQNSEKDLGQQQYEALADRALDLAEALTVRRIVAIKSMANIAASAFPDTSQWPNVAIPAFGTFAEDLINTSDNMEISFLPMVRPEQLVTGEQESFEEYAYDYFYNVRNPPFPNNTAVHQFGRGIWKSESISNRVHDTTGQAAWGSPNQVLFPLLQNSNVGTDGKLFLMFNVHSDETRGEPIDVVIDCAQKRKSSGNEESDCGVD